MVGVTKLRIRLICRPIIADIVSTLGAYALGLQRAIENKKDQHMDMIKVIYIVWLIIKEFMKQSVRQTGVLKRLLFLKCRAWELAIGGSRLASL